MGYLTGKKKFSAKEFVLNEEFVKHQNEYLQNEINKKSLRQKIKKLERN